MKELHPQSTNQEDEPTQDKDNFHFDKSMAYS